MRVIDLLNKIANGEEIPSPIYHKGIYYDFDDGDYFNQKNRKWLFNDNDIETILNDEIEIIEEDKKIPTLKNLNLTKIDINKRGQVFGVTTKEMIADIQTLQNWINKIIDYINEENKE